MTASPVAKVRSGVVTVCLVCDPDLAADVGSRLCKDLPRSLAARVSDEVSWRVRRCVTPLAGDEQVEITELVGDLLPGVEDEEWDVLVFVTDLPRRDGVRPIAAEADPAERVALLSLPALGFWRLYAHAKRAVVRLVAELMSSEHTPMRAQPDPGDRRGKHPRLRARSAWLPVEHGGSGRLRVVGARWLNRPRMISGMVRANRPWRLFVGLSRSMAGVFATAAYGFINVTAWRMGTLLGPYRQVLLAVSSVALLIVWLIVDHELWESADDAQSRQRARLYNATTVITLGVGVLFLYVELFVSLILVQQLLLSPAVLHRSLSIAPGWTDDLAIVWFLTSAAIVGGALGSGFEDDRVVRRATYGARQRERQRQRKERSGEPGRTAKSGSAQ